MTSESLAFDTSNATTATRTVGTGVFMDVDGNFRVGNASGNRLTFTGTSLELVTPILILIHLHLIFLLMEWWNYWILVLHHQLKYIKWNWFLRRWCR